MIHTEEEFDWDGGFWRANTQVSHSQSLVEAVKQIITYDVHVVLAMDYAFVTSENGKSAIESLLSLKASNIEFATHLHPWVNPPFDEPADENGKIEELYSYPGNLDEDLEYKKLKSLTEEINNLVDKRPSSYLAGRYGVGKNTYKILRDLGYKTDYSISAFADFRHQYGPDFSGYTNAKTSINGIVCIPHTTGYISGLNAFSDYLNTDPKNLTKFNNNLLGKVLLKALNVQKVRLSPEGYNLNQIKKLTQSLSRIGIKEFVFSFHSPSVQVGMTPYVKDQKMLGEFNNTTFKFLELWGSK